MARIKFRPRLAQPDPEPQGFSPAAQAMSNAINEYQLRSNQPSDDEDNDPEHLSGLEDRTASEGLLTIRRSSGITNIECPNCHSRFPNMGIRDFREHVESCTRPTTANSQSTSSSLSPPPESHHGEDETDGAELTRLGPYEVGEFNSYAKSKRDAAGHRVVDGVEAQPAYRMPKVTDSEKFVDLFDGAEDMSYDDLYQRVLVAQQALVRWQDEYMRLDRFIEKKIVTAPRKNPRVPRHTQIGIGYQDELESFVYGFEYQYHQQKIGNQNPFKQRYNANGGRELRQRFPTQKAAEADASSNSDSDDEISGRRRGRGQRLREGVVDAELPVGRGQRARNNSRLNSESRDQTPTSNFPSGKKRGRPAKPKAIGGSRLQELQHEEGSDYDSALELVHNKDDRPTLDRLNTAARRASYGRHQPRETTERWNDFTDLDESISRPGTSDSTMTGPSTDDMRNPPGRSSARNRRRQNTSDFEDALPSHKRIGRKLNNPALNGIKDLDSVQSLNDGINAERTRNTRRARQEEDTLQGTSAAAENVFAESTPKSQLTQDAQSNSWAKDGSTLQKKQIGRERKAINLKASNGTPLTPAHPISSKGATTDPLPSTSTQQDGKEGPKMSRASLNMMRRWAAKKQAEALGLPVPKIGRYPKGGSVLSTPDVTKAPNLINSPKSLSGRKRTREEEPNTNTVSLSNIIPTETPILKKRGGRPRKVVNLEPPLNVESAGRHMNSERNGFNASTPDGEGTKQEEPALIIIPKRKGGRPRKKPLDVDSNTLIASSPVQDIHQGDEQNHQIGLDPDDGLDQANPMTPTPPPHTDQSTNGDGLDSAVNVGKFISHFKVRKSSRVRRQTSAAASSQAGTRHSSRSSQKTTVTPTQAPAQQAAEEAEVKQESVAGSVLPRKRGRQPKPGESEITRETTIVAANVEDDEAPPPKRRRIVRSSTVMSTGSTPVPVTDPEEARLTPQEESMMIRKQGSRKRKSSITDMPAPDVVLDAHAASTESLLSKKRARKTPPDKPTVGALSVARASSGEPVVPKKRPGRPRKNINADAPSSFAVGGPVTVEDITRVQEPLTTRARSTGQESITNVNPTEDHEDEGRQVADPEPPKKKGTWGGKRIKGVSLSAAAPTRVTTPGFDANTKTNGVEDQAEQTNINTPGHSPQEPSKKGTWGGPRQKKAISVPTASLGVVGADAEGPSGSLNAPSRPKRTISKAIGPNGEISINDAMPGESPGAASRPKRISSMKTAPTGEVAGDDSGMPPKAVEVTESIPSESTKVEKKKGGWGGRRVKGEKVSATTTLPAIMGLVLAVNTGVNEEALNTKVESDNEDSDSEATAKEKRKAAARASKSAKMSQSMKDRWADGSMHEIMRRKKAANAARKAAAAREAENQEEMDGEDGELASMPASAPTKRKTTLMKDVFRTVKRRLTMNATMDDAADTDTDYDMPGPSSSDPSSPVSRKMSEFARYQPLGSPIRPTHIGRKRRPAALRASQSFGKFTDDGDDIEVMDENDEDVETEIKKQFDSEYNFRATTPPFRGLETSNILSGKRKRKPVRNLEEVMRIEAADDDDLSIEG